MTTQRWLGLTMLLTTGFFSVPAPTNAEVRVAVQWDSRSDSRAIYASGYRQGQAAGERDARAGRRYDVDRHDAYRRADRVGGWGRTDREYAFRQGFAEGYRNGYARFDRRGPRDGYGGYGGSTGYGGYGANIAFDRGYREGLEEGRDAARDRDRYDPRGERDYRSADHGYDRKYGPKDVYKDNYRQGFLQGYERGYRDNRPGYR